MGVEFPRVQRMGIRVCGYERQVLRALRRHGFVAVVLVCLFGELPGPLAAQQEALAPGLQSIPYESWFAAGERQQIPWRVHVTKPFLSFHQRLRATVRVNISTRKLQKNSVRRDLRLFVKVACPSGEWLAGEALRQVEISERFLKNVKMQISLAVLIQPGEYSVGVILYDRVTGERSVTRRRLRVPPLRNDPLPEAASGLPAVEFLPAQEGPDASYWPTVRGVLRLPVRTRRRVQVEVLANFSASEQYAGSRIIQSRNFSILLPTLKLLSGIEFANGSLTITALDLDRQRVFFQQQNTHGLAWPQLREALGTLRTDTVDVRELATRTQRAAFFRDVLERRVKAPLRRPLASGEGSGSERPSDSGPPYRVFIVLGHGLLFPAGSDLKPVPPVEDCRCRVYYVQYRVWWGNLWDQLQRVMKPLEPRHFEVEDAQGMRKALAAILDDLRAL